MSEWSGVGLQNQSQWFDPIYNLMTTDEALQSVLASCPNSGKWYNISSDEKECTHLRVMAMRIQNGTAKPHTIRQFFSKFGIEQEEIQWKKK